MSEVKDAEIKTILDRLRPNVYADSHPIWNRVEQSLKLLSMGKLCDLHVLIIGKRNVRNILQ